MQRGMVDQECDGQGHAGGRGHLIGEFDRHQRVEAEVLERSMRVELLRRVEAQHAGCLVLHVAHE